MSPLTFASVQPTNEQDGTEIGGTFIRELPPPACPCCHAALVESELRRMKYREFRYACGASGFQREVWYENPCIPACELVYRDEITWTEACSQAMPHLMNNPPAN
jgi:hypothetical protein